MLDADALVAFQGAVPTSSARWPATRPLVLTPHPGEFRTLFPTLAPVRELDPWAAAAAGGAGSGATLLLKGVPTVVARAAARRSPSLPGTRASPPAAAAMC